MSENSDFSVKPKHILHSGMFNGVLRDWQTMNCEIAPKNLMYPLFIIEDDDKVESIPSMPGVSRYGINRLLEHLEPLVRKGLSSILLFGVVEKLPKDSNGTHADSIKNPVIRALPQLIKHFPSVTIACDVCLCPYTDHGHCGILNSDGTINNSASLERIAAIALAYAKAGAHIVAPSDMMDGRIGAIHTQLLKNFLSNRVAILSYSCKFASGFYGPFRDAAKSKPAFGDRKCYQLPPAARGLALRAAARDIDEGADILMVKPVMAYLDILREMKNRFIDFPVFVYQVSGEYAMIYHAAKAGAVDLRVALEEILLSMRRAGADVIITYFTPLLLEWMQLKNKI